MSATMSKAIARSVVDVFFALGDATRLAMVRKLGGGVPHSATALSEGARVTRQAIIKHLQVLEGAGLVRHDKKGREVLYALERDRFDAVRDFLDDVSTSWDRAIERLRHLVEEPSPSRRARKR